MNLSLLLCIPQIHYNYQKITDTFLSLPFQPLWVPTVTLSHHLRTQGFSRAEFQIYAPDKGLAPSLDNVVIVVIATAAFFVKIIKCFVQLF